jgi:O-antigen chain-terminating methyltransferase
MGDGPERIPADFIREPDTGLDTWSDIWNRGRELDVSSHRPVVGSLIVLFKKLVRKLVRPGLADLFELQKSFNTVMIHNLRRVESEGITRSQDGEERLLEQTEKINSRSDSLFTVLDKRVETLDRQMDGFAGEQTRQTRAQLEGLTAEYRRNTEQLEELSRRLAELRQQQFMISRRLQRISPPATGDGPAAPEPTTPDAAEHQDDHAYYLFENIFRGPEDVILDRQSVYLPYYRESDNVLDIGCGRGEFLELLRQQGVNATGIDLNEDMIQICREKGFEVHQAEALAHLRSLPEESLGGVFMAQFIEHLPASSIVEAARLSFDKLRPGAHLVMETQNPLSMVVSARNFYTDMSHIRPIHPEAAKFMLQMVGFREVELKFLAPFSPEEQLQPLFGDGMAPPVSDRHLFQRTEDNFRKLNDLMFGYQDFAVIGQK